MHKTHVCEIEQCMRVITTHGCATLDLLPLVAEVTGQ